MVRRSAERVIVFIDWQNLYKGARDAFHDRYAPGRVGMVDPLRLARRLVEASPGRSRELVGVRVYRGQPEPALEAVAALGGNRRPHCEVAAWASSQAVPRLRIAGARLWCHYLGVDDYLAMVDPTDYTSP